LAPPEIPPPPPPPLLSKAASAKRRKARAKSDVLTAPTHVSALVSESARAAPRPTHPAPPPKRTVSAALESRAPTTMSPTPPGIGGVRARVDGAAGATSDDAELKRLRMALMVASGQLGSAQRAASLAATPSNLCTRVRVRVDAIACMLSVTFVAALNNAKNVVRDLEAKIGELQRRTQVRSRDARVRQTPHLNTACSVRRRRSS
jgi:hypothetical protein